MKILISRCLVTYRLTLVLDYRLAIHHYMFVVEIFPNEPCCLEIFCPDINYFRQSLVDTMHLKLLPT